MASVMGLGRSSALFH